MITELKTKQQNNKEIYLNYAFILKEKIFNNGFLSCGFGIPNKKQFLEHTQLNYILLREFLKTLYTLKELYPLRIEEIKRAIKETDLSLNDEIKFLIKNKINLNNVENKKDYYFKEGLNLTMEFF